MYDPGSFSALDANSDKRRNGGVPQEGNLELHLEEFKKSMDELVPDVENNGIIVIDFESWRPILRQNFGELTKYKDVSYQIERNRHPFWSESSIKSEATKRFEAAGRKFVEDTIILSKMLRPNAQIGYYAFPYCFSKGTSTECPPETKAENDRMGWMFYHSHLILPSVYLQEKMKPAERQSMVKARIKEAMRVGKPFSKKSYVYIRYVYSDTRNLLSESDLIMVFQHAKNLGTNGVILWGSSFDLQSRKQCESLQSYLETSIGPVAQSYSSKRIFADIIDK